MYVLIDRRFDLSVARYKTHIYLKYNLQGAVSESYRRASALSVRCQHRGHISFFLPAASNLFPRSLLLLFVKGEFTLMSTSLLVLVFLLGLKIVSAEISFPFVTALHHLSISTFDNYGNAAADVTSDFVQQSQLPTQQVKVLTAKSSHHN